jgi:LmbE family N-acetylglucosaminyl deacetylase
MKRTLLFLISFLHFTFIVRAQTSPQYNAAEILQALEKLNTVGSVLYIAAHPDDENTRLLAYMAKERKLRTGYLSITRGDGGQNLVGKEQGDMLGLMRTQELLAARKIDGAEQFFTRANDFGYSKNPEETFRIWNHDSILADVVWAIRRFKPDVIICRFPTTGEGGHGHHTASAILAVEAFDAAADPKRFPEQLQYTQVWQTRRLFWNTFNFGSFTTPVTPEMKKIDVGVYNPLLGKSYGEIAAESRSNHKSQGFGSAKGRGTALEYFKLLKGDSVKTDLFEGIDQTWKRIPGSSKLQKMIEACISKYDMQKPEKSIPELVNIYKQIQQINETDRNISYWKNQKLKEAETLLLTASGLWMEAYATNYFSTPGSKIDVTAQIINRNDTLVKLKSINFGFTYDSVFTLKKNELYTFKNKLNIAADASYTNPYWLNKQHTSGLYTVTDHLLIGLPEEKPSTEIEYAIEINGLPLSVKRPLVYKYTDPVKGEIYRPFEILPPATINISDKAFIFSDKNPKTIQFTIKSNTKDISGNFYLKVPEGWMVSPQQQEIKLMNPGDELILDASVTPGSTDITGKIEAELKIGANTYNKSIQHIEYDHIPYRFILSDAEAKLVNINLKKTGTNIGYIPGAGDDVSACLKQIGYNVTILTDDLLSHDSLSKYNAIITGVRAYNTNERLQAHYAKLMEYVNNGGNLIVQYNTNNNIGPVQAKIGPYPFTISRDRVTDETAEIRIINPNHPALTFPNSITRADFEGWIQERGIYFATKLDKNYETVLSMNDPGEKASEGSLIIAKYGKGNFVYTGLVFFRELPAGVPGAYRLFANLISLPTNK